MIHYVFNKGMQYSKDARLCLHKEHHTKIFTLNPPLIRSQMAISYTSSKWINYSMGSQHCKLLLNDSYVKMRRGSMVCSKLFLPPGWLDITKSRYCVADDHFDTFQYGKHKNKRLIRADTRHLYTQRFYISIC